MHSYSQYGEDSYFVPLLEKVPESHRRLLEIGAWHPTDKSNSRALFELGWRCILIEPSPGPMLNLLNEYANEPRVQLIQAAVGVESGLIDLMVTDDAVSTTDRAQYEEWKKITKFRGKLTVPCISMLELFTKLGGDFEFVSIDAEGMSVPLFHEMMQRGPRPRVVVVEHDARHVEVAQIAEAANYKQIHLNGTNVILEWTGRKEWK